MVLKDGEDSQGSFPAKFEGKYGYDRFKIQSSAK